MDIIPRLIMGSMISLSASNMLEEIMLYEGPSPIIKPIDKVSIIIPSLNEEVFIEKSLYTINKQSIINKYPEYFETILVDSGSTDNTVELAKRYVDKVIQIDTKGKLTARNIATDLSKGNIIVSGDADTLYPINWLNNLLTPFNDLYNDSYNYSCREPIVAVIGSTVDHSIPYIPGHLFTYAELINKNLLEKDRMTGRNCAYWKHYFYMSGKFNEQINQQNVYEMINEEEKEFGHRLSKLGKVVFKMSAGCYHLGGERIGCRQDTINKAVCDKYKIGIERFG